MIPAIDFAKCALRVQNDDDIDNSTWFKIGTKLYDALSSTGFAYIANHDIQRDTIDKMNEMADDFFSRTLEYKMKYCTQRLDTICYDPVGGVRANPQRPYDYNEGIRFPGKEDGEWPEIPHLKRRVLDFQQKCKMLLLRIMKALGVAMKLKDTNLFRDSHSLVNEKGNMTLLKLLRYPPVTDSIEDNQLRIGEHTDFGSLTLLFQDNIGGLQVQSRQGEFIDVPYVPGTLIINIGDMMQFWSGGRLKSTVHRVVIPTDPNKRAKPRRSIGYFGTIDDIVPLNELAFEDSEDGQRLGGNSLTSYEWSMKRFNEHFFKD